MDAETIDALIEQLDGDLQFLLDDCRVPRQCQAYLARDEFETLRRFKHMGSTTAELRQFLITEYGLDPANGRERCMPPTTGWKRCMRHHPANGWEPAAELSTQITCSLAQSASRKSNPPHAFGRLDPFKSRASSPDLHQALLQALLAIFFQ